MPDENKCQREDFQHLNDLRIVNMSFHQNTCEPHAWLVNYVRRWQAEPTGCKRMSSNEVCW